MTIQEKIDNVVELTDKALCHCGVLTQSDMDYVLSSVKELGFEWQQANAHLRAACILLGLISRKYPKEYTERYIRECVELRQYDELYPRESDGCSYMFKTIPVPLYAELIDMLTVQQIEGKAGIYDTAGADPDGETDPGAADGK